MEITGKVVRLLDAQRFTSKKDGSEIVKNTFVLETQGQYPKNIAFSVMGGDKFAQMAIVVGGTYSVSFDLESREWNGKWFTECSAWRAVRMDGVAQGQQAQQQTNAPVASQPANANDGGGSSSDLPF